MQSSRDRPAGRLSQQPLSVPMPRRTDQRPLSKPAGSGERQYAGTEHEDGGADYGANPDRLGDEQRRTGSDRSERDPARPIGPAATQIKRQRRTAGR